MKRERIKEKCQQPRSYIITTDQGDVRRNRRHIQPMLMTNKYNRSTTPEINEFRASTEPRVSKEKRNRNFPPKFKDFIT